jgi:thiamine kinase-like enzyme
VLQHGDFAPWNIVRLPDGSLRALDWEYANAEGFPYLDIAYYLLQTSLLLRRRSPLRAIEEAVEFLTTSTDIEPLDTHSARSIVGLAAYEQYTKSLEDGHDAKTYIQQCRLSIWKSMP